MLSIGIDIGTTTICAIVFDTEAEKIIESVTEPNDAMLSSKEPWEKIQDAQKIYDKASGIIERLAEKHKKILSIGITGQMHGILYIDKSGNILSPLYFWQDGRGNLTYGEKTYAEEVSGKTGKNLASGYGSVTHFYNLKNDLVPTDAFKFCTIYDYLAMRLAGLSEPVISMSSAASLGITDDKMFPKIVNGIELIGETRFGVKISVAIGDNQASFLGSVRNTDSSLLVNVGTGSQISFTVKDAPSISGTELRPYINDEFLLVGAPLCGGRAYAVLKDFYLEIIRSTGQDCENIYEIMEESVCDIYNENSVDVVTKFSGSRENPDETGSISGITVNNFTMSSLTLGVLKGIVNELYEIFEKTDRKFSTLVGSGNGIRYNKALQKLFSEKFSLQLKMPLYEEEAAFGACLFSLTAANHYKNISEAQRVIEYE